MKYPKKILSTTEFVLWLAKNDQNYSCDADWWMVLEYARLMQTSLSLDQFVPCKDGIVLDKELAESELKSGHINFYEEYEQAVKQILFEGWKWKDGFDGDHFIKSKKYDFWLNDFKTIEHFIQKIDAIGTNTYWNLIFKL